MTSIIALLVVLGIGLVMLAVWLFRLTRPDADLLAPLEVMGERKWRRADPVAQRRRLDQVRPPDAQPLQPSAAPPDLDEAFDRGPSATGFDDLHDDADDRGADTAGSSSAPGSDGSEPAPAGKKATSPTPTGIDRPTPEQLPDHELDPEVLAAAIAELDAELGLGGERPSGTAN